MSATASTANGTRLSPRRVPSHVRRELLVVLAVLLLGSVIGTYGFDAFIRNGHRPFFYQRWFGVAVMEACGRGFHDTGDNLPPPLQAFLDDKADSFDCADLAAGLTPLPATWYQRLYRYLMLTVAMVWKIRGVSWSNLDVLYAALSGAVTALAYGLLRLGAGRVLAVCGALALVSSPLHLGNLPHLRDYFKAPFQLALMLLMGCVVLYGTTRRRVILLACAAGVVLGIGLGFRPDLWLAAGPMALAFGAFLPLPWRGTLGVRASALAIFVATTFVAGAPVLAAYGEGGNSPHVMFLGFGNPFTEALGIQPPDYEILPRYNDRNAELIVRSDAVGRHGGSGNLVMSTAEYDREMSDYLGRVVRALPADVITRAYVAILKIFESPFDWEATQHCGHFAGDVGTVCRRRMAALAEVLPFAVPLGLLTLAGLIAAAPRLGLFALIVVGFFAGGAAIQFNERHYFYLELLTWWAIAFLLQRTASAVWRFVRSDRREAFARLWRWERQGLIALALVIASLGLMLAAARLYQTRTVSRLLTSYRTAATSPVAFRWRAVAPGLVRTEIEDDRLAPVGDDWRTRSIRTEFFRADFGGAGCDYAMVAPVLRYDTEQPYNDLSARFPIRLARRGAIASAFFPAYSAAVTAPAGREPSSTTRFAGLETSEAQARCLIGLERVVERSKLPFLWSAVTRQGQEQAPAYYQKLDRWEAGGDTNGSLRLYSAGTAGVSHRDLGAPLEGLRSTLGYASPGVTFTGDHAIVEASGPDPTAILMSSRPLERPAGSRAVLQGTLERGTIMFTLFDGKEYRDVTTISRAGPFAIAIEARAAGTYQIVVLNRDGRSRRGTRLHVDRLGWVPEASGALQTSD